MRTLCIMNYKGGVGKTTTAVNMAYSLGEMGNKILLVDADQQGNSTYIATRRAYTGKTLRDVMKGAGIRSAIKRSAWSPNVDVVPAKEEMEAVAADPDTLREKLKEVEQEYDYCIIDCHPDMQIMTINALMASDDLLIPMKPDKFSETALEIMGEYFLQITEYNPDINIVGCLFTMFRGRKSQMQVITRLAAAKEFPLMETVISDCEAVNSAQEARKPLAKHRAKAKATEEYRQLAREYLEKVE